MYVLILLKKIYLENIHHKTLVSPWENLPVYFVENCSAAEAAVDAADEGGGGGVGRGTLK